ncbi:ATP-binding protein [Rhodococcus sp. OK302]|uniref:ATP-binding protein n=1 Tax=Rhodococcus sp. OK302 TaxID=1882769 RepID=UPI000B93D3D1|nr:ATP-binding protein [Rhodococcus sp. OK302]OYD60813.1 two-component system sensor histidine kinase PrrB [Rhodococcus sp. OK302]
MLGRAQLKRRVWGYDVDTDTNVVDVFDTDTDVVDVFVTYLHRKLEATGMPRVLHTVRGSRIRTAGAAMRVRRRSPSLRTRVAMVSALAAAIVIAAIGIACAVFLRVNGSAQLDRTLDSVVLSVAAETTIAETSELPSAETSELPNTTIPEPAVTAPGDHVAESGTVRTETLAGRTVRARDVPVNGTDGTYLAVTVPEDTLSQAIRQQQWQVAAAAVAAIAVAAGLGWLLAGRAVRPLQRLAAAMRTVGDDPSNVLANVRGAREAEELSDAITDMLGRMQQARNRTQEALRSARDFAAVSAHELRTPLTSMRTDLEVLATMPLSDEQRAEIVRDVLATQREVETTLTDLERLAVGELSDVADHEEVDLVDLADRCVQESARRLPDLEIELCAPDALTVRGIPSGLRLVLDNAIINAVRHGRAGLVRITLAENGAHGVAVTVDDDGIGIPEYERAGMFVRFTRGSAAQVEGSGLGLALIAQQAALHGGTAGLSESPLGGTRLRLRLPPTPRAHSAG